MKTNHASSATLRQQRAIPKALFTVIAAWYSHSFATGVSLGVQEKDCGLHIVPMFHANAWGAPFACTMCGLNKVFPGRQILDMTAAVPDYRRRKVTFSCVCLRSGYWLHNYLEAAERINFSSIRLFIFRRIGHATASHRILRKEIRW